MIYLADVRDWIKTFNVAENYYIGKLDAKKEKSIGVYQRQLSESPQALGGLTNKKVEAKGVSVLIHWNSNAAETERAAAGLFEALRSVDNVTIAGKAVYYVEIAVNEPIDVGMDDGGIYERVIWLNLYYER